MKQFRIDYLFRDLLIGVVIALISIPISMGYAQIAGLPAVYGLYGSVIPILLFSVLTSSPRFVFGVDAAPAALVGSLLATLGIASESVEARALVPAVALLVSLWLLLFFVLRADRMLKYISSPVMGGFITGISSTIILMQFPKLFGGTAGVGEAFELIHHLIEEAGSFHPLSFALGVGTIVLILVFRRINPKIPASVILMLLGVAASYFCHLSEHGVKMLPAVSPGMVVPSLPSLSLLAGHSRDILLSSLTIAIVILSETLLATNNLGLSHDDRIHNRGEILAYAAGNLGAALFGCCPVNGSVSRSGIADQFSVKSQWMSVSAAVTMFLIIQFGTGFIAWLPVPILTGIVISALIGTLEFDLAHHLRRVDRVECMIFYASFLSVLLFGTIYGVLVGVLLSSVTFIIRASVPHADVLGYVESQNAFYPVDRMRSAQPLRGIVLYRFTGSLFYANIDLFQRELEEALQEDTRAVILDSSGISSIDITAVHRLLLLYRKYRERGLAFYMAGHVGQINDRLREYGAGELIMNRVVRRTLDQALEAAGAVKPYDLQPKDTPVQIPQFDLTEYEWAFGHDAVRSLDRFAGSMAERLLTDEDYDDEKIHAEEEQFADGYWSPADEDAFLEMLEQHLMEQKQTGRQSLLLQRVRSRHQAVRQRLNKTRR